MLRNRMGLTLSTVAICSLLTIWSARAGDEKNAPPSTAVPCAPAAKTNALDKIKALAGEWVLADKPNEPAYCTYRVVSGGTAVMEELMPAGEANMITMYHLNGDAVVLTHYCGLGNQPRMKAKPMSGNKLSFEFTGGCNVQRDGKYMSALSLEFVNADHLKASWTLTDKGKVGEQVTFDLIRKKKA